MKKQKWLIVISAMVMVALLVGAVFLWKGCSAKPQTGSKALTFEVVLQDGTSKEYPLKTDAEYLADALVEKGLVTYAEDGMYNTIAGVTVDWNKDQSWWCISKDGVTLNVGMNTQPIADGEHYEATYTIGY